MPITWMKFRFINQFLIKIQLLSTKRTRFIAVISKAVFQNQSFMKNLDYEWEGLNKEDLERLNGLLNKMGLSSVSIDKKPKKRKTGGMDPLGKS